MPRGCLTEQQKQEARYVLDFKKVCRGLRAYAGAERLTNERVAEMLGVHRKTAGRLMRGEAVELPGTTWIKVLSIAGFSIADAKDGKEQ